MNVESNYEISKNSSVHINFESNDYNFEKIFTFYNCKNCVFFQNPNLFDNFFVIFFYKKYRNMIKSMCIFNKILSIKIFIQEFLFDVLIFISKKGTAKSIPTVVSIAKYLSFPLVICFSKANIKKYLSKSWVMRVMHGSFMYLLLPSKFFLHRNYCVDFILRNFLSSFLVTSFILILSIVIWGLFS